MYHTTICRNHPGYGSHWVPVPEAKDLSTAKAIAWQLFKKHGAGKIMIGQETTEGIHPVCYRRFNGFWMPVN